MKLAITDLEPSPDETTVKLLGRLSRIRPRVYKRKNGSIRHDWRDVARAYFKRFGPSGHWLYVGGCHVALHRWDGPGEANSCVGRVIEVRSRRTRTRKEAS